MTKGTNIEIFVEDDVISLRKVKDSCVFCGSDKDLVNYMDRLVCSDCIETVSYTHLDVYKRQVFICSSRSLSQKQ